jgi:hypothetical protein
MSLATYGPIINGCAWLQARMSHFPPKFVALAHTAGRATFLHLIIGHRTRQGNQGLFLPGAHIGTRRWQLQPHPGAATTSTSLLQNEHYSKLNAEK